MNDTYTYPTSDHSTNTTNTMLRERLSAQANLGFVPIAEEAVPLIASYIAPAPQGARVLDPCAGEGVALGEIADLLGVEKRQRYANELHDTRAKACEQHAGTIVSCDTLKSLQATKGMFQLAYLNPPFGNDGHEEGGGRLEPKFFRAAIEDRAWVQPGGIVIIVTPQDILARQECRNHIARCYDNVQIYALPADIRHYREAVVFGVVRAQFRFWGEYKQEADRLLDVLNGELPVLTHQAEPSYMVPHPINIKKVIFRDASRGTPTTAQQDVIIHGGAWKGKKYRAAKRGLQRQNLAPLFPLHRPQAALRIAAGAINGMTVEIGGVPQVIKGSTVENTITWTEEKDGDRSHTIETHALVRRVPHVVTIDDEGTIRRFVGDAGMAKLMANPGTADALLEAVEDSAPPRYQLDMSDDVADVLQAIQPVSGRSLRGYAPGLLPMQRHVAAGAYQTLTTPDAGWGGVTPHAMLVAAEMGCGKAQPLNANILTPTGWTTMGNIKVGDQIIGAQGTAVSVVGVFPQGEKDIYRVTCSDGSSTECCEEHLWHVTRPLAKWRGQPGQVVQLKDIMHRLRDGAGNSQWFIPMVEPVQFAAQSLPLDPYLLGVLLGDGTLSEASTTISSADADLLDRVHQLLPDGVYLRHRGAYDYAITTGQRNVINPVTTALRTLGLTGTHAESKFIPTIYQFSSVADRVALLQGLLDTDGSVDGKNRIEYPSASKQLARDVIALVQSLGGRATLTSRIPFYTYKGERHDGQRSYRLTIALPSSVRPFRLERKAQRYTPRPKYPPTRAIVNVEFVGRKEAQCIAVDALDHLYVTDDYIVTHNTSIGLAIVELLRRRAPTNH